MGAGPSPLKRLGREYVRDTRTPNMSTSKIEGLAVSTSRTVERSFKLWLLVTFGSPKFDPTNPQNLMNDDRHSFCLEDRDPNKAFSASLADTTMECTVNAQDCQTIKGILSSCRWGVPSRPTLYVV